MLMTKDPRFIRLFKALEPYIPEFEIRQIRIFGSYARGTERKKSDIDIIVDIGKPIGIYQFIGLKQSLEKTLNKKIDLFEPNSIEPQLKDKIIAEAVTIYEQ